MSCERCVHKTVCQFKSDYYKLLEKINGIDDGIIPNPFIIKLDCGHFSSQTNIRELTYKDWQRQQTPLYGQLPLIMPDKVTCKGDE